jgi:hypothetical protein
MRYRFNFAQQIFSAPTRSHPIFLDFGGNMKNRNSKVDLTLIGIGALVGFTILKTLTQPSSRHFDVLYSVHGAKLRFAGENDQPQPKTLDQARSQAERFAISMDALEACAVVMNLKTGEVVAQFS